MGTWATCLQRPQPEELTAWPWGQFEPLTLSYQALYPQVVLILSPPHLRLWVWLFHDSSITLSAWPGGLWSASGGKRICISPESCLCCLELNSRAPSETAQNLQGQTGLPTMWLPRGWSMQNTHFLRPTGCLALDPVPGSMCVNLAPATSLPIWINNNRFWKTYFHLNMSL